MLTVNLSSILTDYTDYTSKKIKDYDYISIQSCFFYLYTSYDLYSNYTYLYISFLVDSYCILTPIEIYGFPIVSHRFPQRWIKIAIVICHVFPQISHRFSIFSHKDRNDVRSVRWRSWSDCMSWRRRIKDSVRGEMGEMEVDQLMTNIWENMENLWEIYGKI